ncbi:MAG: response regulator transcription factor [Bacteroidales bacterium]|nr:response regulator transcription factor [Bacteroidales bacterium]
MIRTIIVDDEIRARETIHAMLEIYCSEAVEVIGEAKNVASGIEIIKKLKPDLVLLDIKMPDGLGFDLLARYGNIDFKVIFITAFEEYAIQAFKFSAIDYILKPIEPDELIKAINRVKDLVRVTTPNSMDLQFETFMANMQNNSGEEKKLVLKTTENIHVIPINEIVALSSDRNYTRFYFLERPNIIVSKTLKEFENMLVDYGFMRVHRSHVINLKYIDRFDKSDGGYAVMRGGLRMEVSHRNKESLFAFFEKL